MHYHKQVPRSAPASPPPQREFNDNQRRLLGLLASGLSKKEIAARLAVRPHEVSRKLRRLKALCGAGSTEQLMVIATREGLL